MTIHQQADYNVKTIIAFYCLCTSRLHTTGPSKSEVKISDLIDLYITQKFPY